ncbi:MAG: hypothetical protein KGZ74_04040 [Chitinophagaceae bacterium]|nr:hypothetical protein [Chitinophagaceae bacterium]
MNFPGYISWLILLIGGICWLITYLLIIYRSFKDKSYGMPFTGLALNISWEYIYGFIVIPAQIGLQTWVNRMWFVLDVFILIAYMRYGKTDWPKKESHWLFWPHLMFTLTAGFVLLLYFEKDFESDAITYSAFLMNMLFSGLYINMFFFRNSLKGQSVGIAFFKLIGTACASLYLLNGFTFFLQLTGLICFVLDSTYLLLIVQQYKKENRNIFTRRLKTLPEPVN